eukprot:3697557-Heterocapsa_arctica.AAC.1
MQVKSTQQHIAFAFAALWKGIAVETGVLAPLWIEDILRWRPIPESLPKVGSSLCTGSATARAKGKEFAD